MIEDNRHNQEFLNEFKSIYLSVVFIPNKYIEDDMIKYFKHFNEDKCNNIMKIGKKIENKLLNDKGYSVYPVCRTNQDIRINNYFTIKHPEFENTEYNNLLSIEYTGLMCFHYC
jgi:hypothetical protein